MKIKATVALSCALFLAMTPSLATASEDPSPADPGETLTAQVQGELDAVPDSPLRDATEQHVDEVLAGGGEVLSVSYAPFTPDASAARGDVSTMALPAGCGSTVTASKVGLVVYNYLVTSCSQYWSKNVFRQRIVFTNPYNPYDYGTLVDSVYTYDFSGNYQTRQVQFNCKNSNETHYSMYGRNTAVFNGVPYTAEVGDFLTSIACGK